jgi:hypothetical protein
MRRSTSVTVVALVVLLQGLGFARQSDDRERELALTTLRAMLEAAQAIEMYAIDNAVYPDIEETAYAYDVLSIYLQGAQLVDSWGTTFAITSTNDRYSIVSAGSDRQFDDALAKGATREWSADIVVDTGELLQWPALAITHRPPSPADCRETERRMKIIGASLDLYRAAYNQIPETSSIHELSELLFPSFAGPLPLEDAWGNPFRLSTSSSSWSILSVGKDGRRDIERSETTRMLPRDDLALRSSASRFAYTCSTARRY